MGPHSGELGALQDHRASALGWISADEFDLIGGRREQLLAQIEEVYRVSTTMAQSQLESWQAEQREPQPGVA